MQGQTVAVEARKDAADESGVSRKSIAHRDFAALCCYLQILTPVGRKPGGTDDRTAHTRHREARAGLRGCAPQDWGGQDEQNAQDEGRRLVAEGDCM